jgi:hypothetical protein
MPKYIRLILLSWCLTLVAASSAIINLDSVFVPKTGSITLAPDTVYTLTKGKWLRSNDWSGQPNTTIKYTGGRDSAALYNRTDDSTSIRNLTINGSEWTYSIAAADTLNISNVTYTGGTGLLLARGAKNTIQLDHVTQLQTSWNYGIYVGPESITKRDLLGNITSYTEINTRRLIILHCSLEKGSAYVAQFRAGGCDFITCTDSQFTDTDEQSAPGAVKNAVLRIHGLKAGDFQRDSFVGDVFLGSYDTTHDVPPGPIRNFGMTRRVQDLKFKDCTFDCGSFTIAPGVTASFDHCTITVKSSSVIQTRTEGYLVQALSNVTFTDCTLISTASNSTPEPFTVSGGAKNMKLVRTKLLGRR